MDKANKKEKIPRKVHKKNDTLAHIFRNSIIMLKRKPKYMQRTKCRHSESSYDLRLYCLRTP